MTASDVGAPKTTSGTAGGASRTASGVGRPSAAEQTAAVLAAAVAEIGGHERPGQLTLAAAVGDAFDTTALRVRGATPRADPGAIGPR